MKEKLASAIKAALIAGKDIMDVYKTDFDVFVKSDNSPLTLADQKANTSINAILKPTDIPVISEENKQEPFKVRQKWDTCWMVDPLDGTKEFLKQNGEFTVNIALIEHSKPVMGVIYVPVSKTLYYAVVSERKAFKCDLQSHKLTESVFETRTEIYPVQTNTGILKIVGSRSHQNETTLNYIATLQSEGHKTELVSKGSSLKFCMVAEGLAAIYPRFAPTMEWDTAAGHAICKAVGVSVNQIDGQEEIRYNKADLLNPYFIVQ
ncbi:3'(2'),5'-bisphosphate nucleotidase CysQ [Hyunsoonleella sp. SJ7]|uniref:3'(2'),5'-bisphosphate nucleotidase CysQ n=1 Tax=Hyunsoonleella aquatilis TaxID=2762758 RepID=A0A923HE30_9FLAO|nr:3'(2'),5'-bisphosphate nucleotidase CysQ [Hyunsoonleella aquatilis]MBC3757740.1 3'(2'),5'-bisphosphate nucleotidase CysQ [Hyunsoonleella aquatilis]